MHITTSKPLVASVALGAVLFLASSCSSGQSALPTDEAMTNQWQLSKATLAGLIAACGPKQTTVSLGDRYQATDKLITPNSLDAFGDCEPEALPESSAYPLKYMAKTTTADTESIYLLVTHQHRKGTGWIEEAASRWTGGWVSWKSSILEEKGFLYVADGNLTPILTRLPQSSLVEAPLDKFSGEYRPTSQISGNSSCEIWRIRPISPTWALFYHQARECPT